MPLGVVAAVGGGAWWPSGFSIGGGWLSASALVAGVVGLELLVRGRVHGGLVKVYPVMLPAGRHFVSVPNGVAALISASATMACIGPPVLAIPGSNPVATVALWAAACLVMGLVCGGVRERWGSVWAAVLVHLSSALIASYVVVQLL